MERLLQRLTIILLLGLTPLPILAGLIQEVILANAENLGMVIDVPDARFYDGVKLQVWEYYSNGQNQTLFLEYLNENTIIIETEFLKEKAFDVTDGIVANNQPVQLWYVHPQSDIQRWKMEVWDGCFIFRSCLDNNYVLAVESPVTNGSKVVIQKFTGDLNQQWIVVPYKDEQFKIYYDEYKALYDNAP